MTRCYLLLLGLFFGLESMAQDNENVKNWTLQECIDQAWEKKPDVTIVKTHRSGPGSKPETGQGR